MDNNIQIFNNEELGTIRIMGTPDVPLFCLGDVCKMLGLPLLSLLTKVK